MVSSMSHFFSTNLVIIYFSSPVDDITLLPVGSTGICTAGFINSVNNEFNVLISFLYTLMHISLTYSTYFEIVFSYVFSVDLKHIFIHFYWITCKICISCCSRFIIVVIVLPTSSVTASIVTAVGFHFGNTIHTSSII